MSNQIIKDQIERLFLNYPQSSEVLELKEQLLADLTEKYQELMLTSTSKEEAISKTMDGLGDIGEMMNAFSIRKVGVSTKHYYCFRNLEHTDFSGAELPRRRFSLSNLDQINFKDSNLEGSKFNFANLDCANFSNAKLQGSSLRFSNLDRANFSHANLTDCKLSKSNLEHANFKGALLHNTNFNCSNLEMANFEDAELINVNFRFANISRTSFRGSMLRDIKLGSWSRNSDFTNAKMDRDMYIKLQEKGVDLSLVTIID